MKDAGEMGPCMTMLKFWHVDGLKGYKCIEICKSPELYDKHCMMIGNHEVAQEAMKLGELVKETSGRVYGLPADLKASEMLPQYYPTIERVHGTPIVESWGKPFYGWCN